MQTETLICIKTYCKYIIYSRSCLPYKRVYTYVCDPCSRIVCIHTVEPNDIWYPQIICLLNLCYDAQFNISLCVIIFFKQYIFVLKIWNRYSNIIFQLSSYYWRSTKNVRTIFQRHTYLLCVYSYITRYTVTQNEISQI